MYPTNTIISGIKKVAGAPQKPPPVFRAAP